MKSEKEGSQIDPLPKNPPSNGLALLGLDFGSAKSKTLNHYILRTLHNDQRDVVFLHIGSNDINNQTKDKTKNEQLIECIINNGKRCINFSVKEVIIPLILSKNNFALTRLTFFKGTVCIK